MLKILFNLNSLSCQYHVETTVETTLILLKLVSLSHVNIMLKILFNLNSTPTITVKTVECSISYSGSTFVSNRDNKAPVVKAIGGFL